MEATALASSLFYYYFPAVAAIAAGVAEIMTDAAVWTPAGLSFFFCCSAAVATMAAISTTVADAVVNHPFLNKYRLLRELPPGSSRFNSNILFPFCNLIFFFAYSNNKDIGIPLSSGAKKD